MSFNIGDILLFERYNFNDSPDGNIRKHYAFVMVPSDKSKSSGQIYCAVITSIKPSDGFYFELNPSKYKFFTKNSYICFLRLDFQSIGDIDDKVRQPIGKLNTEDVNKCFIILKKVLYSSTSPIPYMPKYLKSVLMREWKKSLGL